MLAAAPDTAPLRRAGALGHRHATGSAATAAAVIVALFEVGRHSAPPGPSTLIVFTLAFTAVAPMFFARAHPLHAAAVTATSSFLLVAYDQTLPWAVMLAAATTSFWIARTRPLPLVGLVIAPYALIAALPVQAARAPSTIAAMASVIAAAGLGVALHARDRTARLKATAHRAERTLLEHVALGERARIARELHDVVAHHISMIAVQAEAARLLTPDLAPEGQRRLSAIGDTAREALTEMRRLLGVLREDLDTATPMRQPQPGLAQLDTLVDDARALTGSTVRLIVHGHVARLDPGIELTVYRIVQEALTNARRHAAGAPLDVELDYQPDALHLRVRDSGPGSHGAGRTDGHGLDGMHERATMLGGTLTAGTLARGGFAVTAALPYTSVP